MERIRIGFSAFSFPERGEEYSCRMISMLFTHKLYADMPNLKEIIGSDRRGCKSFINPRRIELKGIFHYESKE